MTATLTLENDALVLKCRYNARLVNDIKSLPVADRAFDPQRKTWRIAPTHGAKIASMLRDYLGEEVDLPAVQTTRRRETRKLEVKYIGMSKDRSGERAAFGWCDGGWTVIFPEAELRRWFGAELRETHGQTLYQILAISPSADLQGIKTAYRRLARQWHPDVCQEPNATAMFRSIQEAYELLSDAGKRARYDAGLRLMTSIDQLQSTGRFKLPDPDDYRSPLRCGIIQATGFYQLGRFVVETILSWDDIVDEFGRVLSVSWRSGADRFSEVWT